MAELAQGFGFDLETPIGEEEDSHLGDFIPDEGASEPSEAASFTLLKEQLRLAMETTKRRLASASFCLAFSPSLIILFIRARFSGVKLASPASSICSWARLPSLIFWASSISSSGDKTSQNHPDPCPHGGDH